jgi:hypothetical protein
LPRTKVGPNPPPPRRHIGINVPVHPELHRLLVNENHVHQRTLSDGFHAILCEHFRRLDLLGWTPPRRAATSNGDARRAR